MPALRRAPASARLPAIEQWAGMPPRAGTGARTLRLSELLPRFFPAMPRRVCGLPLATPPPGRGPAAPTTTRPCLLHRGDFPGREDDAPGTVLVGRPCGLCRRQRALDEPGRHLDRCGLGRLRRRGRPPLPHRLSGREDGAMPTSQTAAEPDPPSRLDLYRRRHRRLGRRRDHHRHAPRPGMARLIPSGAEGWVPEYVYAEVLRRPARKSARPGRDRSP